MPATAGIRVAALLKPRRSTLVLEVALTSVDALEDVSSFFTWPGAARLGVRGSLGLNGRRRGHLGRDVRPSSSGRGRCPCRFRQAQPR